MTVLIIFAPFLSLIMVFMFIKASYYLFNYPQDLLVVMIPSAVALMFAYPLTLLFLLPAEKLRKKCKWHPVVFFTLVGALLGLVFSAVLSPTEYVPTFTVLGTCHGLVIGLFLWPDKRLQS